MDLSPEYQKLLEYALWGGLGGLVATVSKERRLTLPRLVAHKERNGEVVKMIDPGFLTSPFVGSALAIYFDTSPVNALAWGFVGGLAGGAVINTIVDGLLRKVGLIVGGLPETSATPAPTTWTGGK